MSDTTDIEWNEVAKATTAQRRALHRLGAADSLIAMLDCEQADRWIKRKLAERARAIASELEALADEILLS